MLALNFDKKAIFNCLLFMLQGLISCWYMGFCSLVNIRKLLASTEPTFFDFSATKTFVAKRFVFCFNSIAVSVQLYKRNYPNRSKRNNLPTCICDYKNEGDVNSEIKLSTLRIEFCDGWNVLDFFSNILVFIGVIFDVEIQTQVNFFLASKFY